ncbi:MAG: hypothetical protein AAGK37_23705 [Pseudomonadota bacterium]
MSTPGVDPGTLGISALDLLGRNPYGSRLEPRIRPDAQTLDIVSDIADRMAEMARRREGPLRMTFLMYAAEMQAALGNRAEALRLLEELPKTDNPFSIPSEELIRLVGSQDVLRLYQEAGGERSIILLSVASAETDTDLATGYLEEAFTAFSSETPWPDYDWMERIVEGAARLGFQALALDLAQELAHKVDTAPSVFPVFSHLKAARALMVAGADDDAVQDRLEHAERQVPASDRQIVGTGVVSGLIAWGSSGLSAQARREMANLRARLGETDAAVQIMEGIDDPVFAWSDMLTSDIPIDAVDRLLDAARDVLSSEGHAYTRAAQAQEMVLEGTEQQSWARATATALLQTEQLVGDRAVLTYSILRRVGARLEDEDIQRLALTRMATSALETREFEDLIYVGLQWDQSDLMP